MDNAKFLVFYGGFILSMKMLLNNFYINQQILKKHLYTTFFKFINDFY